MRDTETLDLLSWEPPETAPAFAPDRVRAISLRDRISLLVSEVMRESGLSRGEIAAAMTDYLGESVSETMLEQYASQARQDQSISLVRAFGLMRATGDIRHFQVGFEESDYAIIYRKYLPAIDEAILADQEEQHRRKIDELVRLREQKRRDWKTRR